MAVGSQRPGGGRPPALLPATASPGRAPALESLACNMFVRFHGGTQGRIANTFLKRKTKHMPQDEPAEAILAGVEMHGAD